MNFKKYILVITSLVLITGCGGGSSSSANSNTNPDGSTKTPNKIQKVSYSLNGVLPPSCDKPAMITVLKAQTEDDTGITQCIWLCGEYEGAKPISVMLSFVQKGSSGVWQYDGDIVSTASNECHN